MTRQDFLAWNIYLDKKATGEIVDRQEYYFTMIMQFMLAYAGQKPLPNLDELLIKFKAEKIKSKEEIEDEARAKEEAIFKNFMSHAKVQDKLKK